MSFIKKFSFIVFLSFITLNVYALDIPSELMIQVIKESQKQDTVKTKHSDLISVKYTGWIFDSNVSTKNHCDAKGEIFDSNILEKFKAHHSLQCGFCTPGFLMIIDELLKSKIKFSENEIREALSGNLCRCTGYENIIKAANEILAHKGIK